MKVSNKTLASKTLGKCGITHARVLVQDRKAARSLAVKSRYVVAAATTEPGRSLSDSIDEDAIASGEWPANWSLASYEDVGEYYAGKMFKEGVSTANNISGIMQSSVVLAKESDTIENVQGLLRGISGVPVVGSDGTCVGVVSKKDLDKSGKIVSEVMTTPPITIKKSNSIAEAAAVMLKYKVDRLPVVSSGGKVVGIVSRTDIFTALESVEE